MAFGSKIKIFLVVSVVMLLMFTNPSERQFLERVSLDYGSNHYGVVIDHDLLLEMGKSDRASFFIFSKFSYQYGNISVTYFGIANSIFFMDSKVNSYKIKKKSIKKV